MPRVAWLLIVGLAASAVCSSQQATPTARPNLLLIIADDCTWSDLEVHGGQAKTPNLKKLAAAGMQLDRCFQAAPMCSPTRHALYSGLYPVKSGAWPNHTRAYDWVKSIAHYLQAGGYRTHLSGKTHIAPRAVFPFEYSRKKNNPDDGAIDKLFDECAEAKTPFLLIAASNEPHSPWTKGDAWRYPARKLTLPPVLADTPRTRELYSAYLAEITYFDSQVGNILALLDKHELAENTLVIVVSEQGNAFPFAKWTCYEAGLRSALIARWPGKIKPGTRSDALIEYVDVVPTFLEATGLGRPDILDGESFLGVLTGQASEHKDHVFGLQTSRGINSGPEHYGIRSVRDRRYRYVRNLTPEAVFQNTVTQNGDKFGWATWKQAAAAGDTHAAALLHEYQHRPAEELFDCDADPWNRTNLIDREKLAPVAARLRAQLDRWMKDQGDRGQATEMKANDRRRRRGRKKQ